MTYEDAAKELYLACKGMMDHRYMMCRFPDGTTPCGCCEACEFTTEVSARAVDAIAFYDEIHQSPSRRHSNLKGVDDV